MSERPERIGRYVVERELGAGGMGRVYLAYSPGGEPVAVKVIRPDRIDEVARARFEREAQIARTVIGTSRVARFLDADPLADQPWMAVEYVPGRTVLDHVADTGPLPLPLVASLGALLAEGLERVHEVDLLHRDLKPANVMLGEYGPVVVDFGLGAFVDGSHETLTQEGFIVGTVRCMAPEQMTDRSQVQAPADVYGLGTVLLYAACGHYPYDGEAWPEIALKVTDANVTPDLSGVPAALVPLLTAMLAHDAADRPTLSQVTEQCVALLSAERVTPVQARYALIDVARSARPSPPVSAPEPGPGSGQTTVAVPSVPLAPTRILTDDDWLSPLDLPAPLPPENGDGDGDGDSEDPTPDEELPPTVVLAPPTSQSSPELGPTAGLPSPRSRRQQASRGRVSRKVAEELRADYAMRAAL